MQQGAQSQGLPPSNPRSMPQQCPVTTASGYSLVNSQHHDQQYRQTATHHHQDVIYEAPYMQQQQHAAQQHDGGSVGILSQVPNSSTFCPTQQTAAGPTTTVALQHGMTYQQVHGRSCVVHGQEIQSEEQQHYNQVPVSKQISPGTSAHSQGKLRVINQGMMNATENIQTSEDASTPTASANPSQMQQQGSEGQFAEGHAPDDANPLANVIETPISTKQLSWLTQPKPPPRSEENSTEVPTQATQEEGVTVSAGLWSLPASEGEEEGGKKPSAAASSSSTGATGASFPNWHLLTNVQQQQQRPDGPSFPTVATSSGNILKQPGSGDNMLAIRCFLIVAK